MKEQLLRAALAHYEGAALKARANLEVYLNSAAGIGEHKDIVQEVVELTAQIAEAEDSIQILNDLLVETFHGELND